MRTTLTIRTDEALRDGLAKLASAQGRTLSDLVREILERALAERPLLGRIGHLRGKLRLRPPEAGTWRERLRAQNWRS